MNLQNTPCDPNMQALKRARFTKLPPAQLKCLNILCARRTPICYQDTELAIAFTPTFKSGPGPAPGDTSLSGFSVEIGDEKVSVHLPAATLKALLKFHEIEQDPAELTLGPIIEFILERALIDLETVFGVPIKIWPVETSETLPDVRLTSGVELNNDIFDVQLGCSDRFLARMTERIAGIETSPCVVSQALLPISITTRPLPLKLRELRALKTGDAIVFHDSPDGLRKLHCCLVDGHFYDAVRDGHRIKAEGGLQQRRVKGDEEMVMAISTKTDVLQGPDESVEDVLIDLSFEIGRHRLSIGNLQQLAAGFIFEMDDAPGNDVAILAGGKKIGEGELVEIGNTLGVRTVKIFDE
ncbi:MAG: FliM/FliN family flagellar motor switch protein [Pseudomonadota bacterium]